MTGTRQSMELASRLDLQIGNTSLLRKENWDFADESTRYLLHNIHPYAAKFIPQIPRRAISRWSESGDLVIDPFCGSGTALLESALAGRNSIGIDNNAVATLVAKAKVSVYKERDLQKLEEMVMLLSDYVNKIPKSKIKQALKRVPDYPYRAKWFEDNAIIELGFIKNHISELRGSSKLLALAVFSAVVTIVSRQDSETRYAAIEKPFVPGSAIKKWVFKMEGTIRNARETSKLICSSKNLVYTDDSRRMSFVKDESVKLLITSPPYLNAYDYHKYHRHRLHWIDGDVEFARDNEIGKHDTFTRPNATPEPFFNDLRMCMKEWERILEPRGRAFVVIGDSIVSGQFVPVGDTLVKIAKEIGLELESRWIRNLAATRKSFNKDARIKREHLLLFKKRR